MTTAEIAVTLKWWTKTDPVLKESLILGYKKNDEQRKAGMKVCDNVNHNDPKGCGSDACWKFHGQHEPMTTTQLLHILVAYDTLVPEVKDVVVWALHNQHRANDELLNKYAGSNLASFVKACRSAGLDV